MVLSSLLVAGVVSVAGAGPNDKKVPTTGSAATGSGSAAPVASAPDAGSAAGAGSATPAIDPATVPPSDMPTPVRMRRIEQKTQVLKERAWQLKARVQLLKEQMLGSGVGAQALIAHASEMGSSFRLIKLIYTLDGTQIFVRNDEAGDNLFKSKSFEVFAGPISPGNHNILAAAVYRGHGYGVFEYLSKYTFTANGVQAFTAIEGKVTKLDCRGFEKGGSSVPLEKRAALECKVTTTSPERVTEKPAPTPTPAPTTPAPTTEPGK